KNEHDVVSKIRGLFVARSDDEPFAVGMQIDISARRTRAPAYARIEPDTRLVRLKRIAVDVIRDRHHPRIRGVKKEKFVRDARPCRVVTWGCRDLPLASRAWKRPDEHLIASRLVR